MSEPKEEDRVERDDEVPEADAAEQHAELYVDEDDNGEPVRVRPPDVDEADAADQDRFVGPEEDDRR